LLGTGGRSRGTSPEEIPGRQRAGGPQPPSSLRVALPPIVDEVLCRSLGPDPARRHPSATELARALAAALRDAVEEVRPPEMRLDAGETAEVQTNVRGRPPLTVETPRILAPIREPEAPAADVPHTRGALFRSSSGVLGARHGAAWVAQVSRRNPALAQALQPQSTLLSWHPTELFVAMLEAIAQSGRDAGAFARELGRVATGATFGRFFGANPAALSPSDVLMAADLFWRRYHTW